MNLIEDLRNKKLRVTAARVNVLKLLYDLRDAVSAYEIHQMIKNLKIDMSLPTIYKTLSEFESKKIVRSVGLGGFRKLFILNDSLIYCNILSSKTHEPVIFDKELLNEKLKNFVEGLNMDVESVEFIIYRN